MNYVIIVEVLKVPLTWIVTAILNKLLNKKFKMKKMKPYVAWVVSFILTLLGYKMGLVMDPMTSTVISGAGSNSVHSLLAPLRRKMR